MAKFWWMALALIVGAGFWAAPAAAQSSKVEQLESQISTLRSEIDSLKSVNREGQGGGDASIKPALKKGAFSWATEDGKFSFSSTFRFQVRFTYNDQRADDVDDPDSGATNGRDYIHFNIRRAKWSMSGNIFEKEYKYSIVLVFNKGASNNMIEDAFFTWAKYKEVNVSAGQVKVPFTYSFQVSSGKQQFIDRSIVHDVFNQDWGKGIWLSGKIGETTTWVKYWFGVFNGAIKSTTGDFRNADQSIGSQTFSSTVDNEMMPALRVETHPMGDVPDDMTDMRGEADRDKILFSVGLALNWFQSRFSNANIYSDNGTAPGSGRFRTAQDTLALTLDGHFRFYGLSVNIAWVWRHTNFHNTGNLEGNNITRNRNRPGDMDDNGLEFEVGFFILPKQLDVGLRYAMVNADEFWIGGSTTKAAALRPDSSEVGLVVGYYIAGHNLKIQMDFTYITHQLAFFATNATFTGSSLGSSPNNDGLESRSATSFINENSDYINVWQWRIQLQWIF